MLALFVVWISFQLAECLDTGILHCQIIDMERVAESNHSPFNTMHHVSDNWTVLAKVMPSYLSH
jgi:hypothetical protein